MGSSSDSGDGGVWGRQAGRQAVSQSEKKRFSPATERRGFFFLKIYVKSQLKDVPAEKKEKRKEKGIKSVSPVGRGRGGRREGMGGGVEADGVRWEPGAARGSDSSSAVSRGNQTGLLLCGSLFPQSTRQQPALATRPFSPGSSADPRLAGLRADQPVSWKSKGIAVS